MRGDGALAAIVAWGVPLLRGIRVSDVWICVDGGLARLAEHGALKPREAAVSFLGARGSGFLS